MGIITQQAYKEHACLCNKTYESDWIIYPAFYAYTVFMELL